MELYEAFRGTFAARHFTDDPVSDETVARLLENARFAPSGGNRQGWRVVVVRSPETRAALEPLMLPTMQRYVAEQRAGVSPWNPLGPSPVSAETCAETEVPDVLLAPLRTAPVLLFLFLDLGKVAAMDQHLERVGVISGASIYPFAWNILLAAHAEGLGGTLTTFLAPEEDAVAKLLEVPKSYAFAAMIPLGVPSKRLTKLRRNPVSSFATPLSALGEGRAFSSLHLPGGQPAPFGAQPGGEGANPGAREDHSRRQDPGPSPAGRGHGRGWPSVGTPNCIFRKGAEELVPDDERAAVVFIEVRQVTGVVNAAKG